MRLHAFEGDEMTNVLRQSLVVHDHNELRPDTTAVQTRDSRVADLTERARASAQQWKAIAASKAKEAQRLFAKKSAELRSRTHARSEDARVAFNRIKEERPLAILGAAATAGVVVGAALRIWRSNRA